MYIETHAAIVKIENNNIPTDIIEMKNVYFPEMECELIPYYITEGKNIFPLWVELEKTE